MEKTHEGNVKREAKRVQKVLSDVYKIEYGDTGFVLIALDAKGLVADLERMQKQLADGVPEEEVVDPLDENTQLLTNMRTDRVALVLAAYLEWAKLKAAMESVDKGSHGTAAIQ